MNELLIRSATAVALILLSLMSAVVGGYYFAVFVAAAATLLFYEWSRIVRGWGFGWNASGFIFALIPALSLLWIRDRASDNEGLALVLWIFIITWAADTGGYFAGRRFGGRKLAPRISPNKTWAGLYGGVALATLAGAAWVVAVGLNNWLILLAPVFAVAAQGGDLFESWMKRQAGVKDSGDWLPGHGGLFDRIDGMIPVAVLTLAAEVAGFA